jgi:hypothetical protein
MRRERGLAQRVNVEDMPIASSSFLSAAEDHSVPFYERVVATGGLRENA